MEESKALVASTPLTVQAWSLIQDVAPAMFASKFFGVLSNEQAMAIMVKGYELGLSLGASFEFIHVIQGKPGLSPRGMLALIQQHPAFAGMTIEDKPESCRVTMRRKNGFEYTAEFSMDDAKRAGLVKPGGGWEKYPANMLRWRAVGFCADVVFPDVLGGMKRTDELGADLTAEGETIEAEYTIQSPKQAQPKTPTPKPKSAIRKPGQEPQSPDVVREVIRTRAGWIKTDDGLVRDTGDKVQPIHADTRQHVSATLIEALQFEGATEQDLADNAKVLLKWLFGTQSSSSLTEVEGKAIGYAWMKPGGGLNEYAKAEINAVLAEAL